MEINLKDKMDEKNLKKLVSLRNNHFEKFIEKYVILCNPDRVFLCDDSPEDVQYIREKAIVNGEERKIGLEGQTVHFDNYYDQGRDVKNTLYLLPEGVNFGPHIEATEREKGLKEIHEILKNIMKGREVYIRLFCLGPVNSPFSISAVQITDSAYVAHSEDLLYRGGYEQFKNLKNPADFFKFVHSEGELENSVSKNLDKRRIYMDLIDNTVYSTNTQYGGNTIGLKKLAMRLAINKASKEDWLTEHMLVMGVNGPDKRKTYFTGAFPSACGKTSTAMLPGENIIGDDIAYLRIIDGEIRTVNVEKGIFGIIKDVNPIDDPLIWEVLNTPGEVIFSNVLIDKNNIPRWQGDGREMPSAGINHSGEWFPGKKDKEGKAIPLSHSNARYTLSIDRLGNLDQVYNDPRGVPVSGIIYGGRDSDTSVPLQQSFDWEHGIITKGAMLESETTSATIGAEGVRKFNLMSNIEFLSYTIGEYIKNNLNFGKRVKNPPLIFSVNYFLKNKDGNYLNTMEDKRVWIKWMELRVRGDVKAIKTPGGYIPEYKDLKELFKEVLHKDYKEEEYIEQFTIRVPQLLTKLDRMEKIYKLDVSDTPDILFQVLEEERERLKAVQREKGDYISPVEFKER
ncbi:MAG TPA: phosphoenolpyruvate carboxykinase (GTP) [Candidatus Eremiobacteraeota bacterium]|nr:MAG: Phosphoenolpyruvate carboxykinase (GTP) [bacterium ADurb.Bin363]HPZ09501.1 phosphoenolpyruvate carboxykinase (GTP) [Candidatus Eremiobacteraeota bacterium]